MLERDFFARNTREVARNLLGKKLVRIVDGKKVSGRIVEVEAYLDERDVASHARFGKTERNHLMFEEPGFVYVYLIYGVYNCLNFTTEKNGVAGAVLIRAVEPIEGIELMMERRNTGRLHNLTSGPGKLCMAFEIDRGCNMRDCVSDSELYLEDDGFLVAESDILSSKRIGVKNDLPEELRYYIKNNKFVSKGG